MISKREVAQRLDIPVEMATRHGIPNRMSEAEFAELEQHPPAWLVQSRANRRAGARPVWMQLSCDVCGFTETLRPKKWWPDLSKPQAELYTGVLPLDEDGPAAPPPGRKGRAD